MTQIEKQFRELVKTAFLFGYITGRNDLDESIVDAVSFTLDEQIQWVAEKLGLKPQHLRDLGREAGLEVINFYDKYGKI